MTGIFFLERVSRLKRDMALKKWKKRAGGCVLYMGRSTKELPCAPRLKRQSPKSSRS
jgi:hypothetical protein